MKAETLKQAIEIAKLLEPETATTAKSQCGCERPVIVRSRDAGVLFGIYVSNDGSTITLKDARQLWKWFAAKGGTLADVAKYGVRPDKCRFSTAKANVTIFNACAMFDVSDAAAKLISETEGEAWK